MFNVYLLDIFLLFSIETNALFQAVGVGVFLFIFITEENGTKKLKTERYRKLFFYIWRESSTTKKRKVKSRH
jgi:hypothetical protein